MSRKYKISTITAVPSVKAGVYAFTVRDRSDEHNFHLRGAVTRGPNR